VRARRGVLHAAAVALGLAFGLAIAPAPRLAAAQEVTVGSKAFPESWILGEALAIAARDAGASPVEHRSNLGGTEIVYEALRSGAIDAYPEYTGTIVEVILRRPGERLSLEEIRAGLAPDGLDVTAPLGFNDGYGLAVTRGTASRLGLRRISDLAGHRDLRAGLTHEFLGRADGWPGLARAYGFELSNVRGIQHELAWEALKSSAIDLTDVYTTDAQIEALDLVVLEDDRAFFPRYDALVLVRQDFAARAPRVRAAFDALAGTIPESTMTRANGMVVIEKKPFAEAADWLVAAIRGGSQAGAVASGAVSRAGSGERGALERWTPLARHFGRHLWLVFASLALAVVIGIPLGILATRARALAAVTLTGAGLLQTIPSLALLAFLIPLLGIGTTPALVALFLYSLLPIVRNTFVGLTTVPPQLVEAAHAIGLSPRARLVRVFLPMASPTILAGIRTSAVINVGTATIAALVGAGGLGEPILSGIQLRDPGLILQGAIPAALLALLVEWGFAALERRVVPAGLRLAPAGGAS
jgi:osmoprotectant transport system permease protein